MQLITFLLNMVAILTLLTGVAVLFGINKKARVRGVWFFLAALGAGIWSAAIATFLTLPEDLAELSQILVNGSILGVTFTNVALVGYTGWASRIGKALTVCFVLMEAVFMGMLIANPGLLYSDIVFGADCNQLVLVNGWYLYLLMGFCGVVLTTYLQLLTNHIKRQKDPNAKKGFRIFQVGLLIGGVFALVFNLILATPKPELIWIGPMEAGITIILFYYSVLRYRILVLTKHWIRILSYIIIICIGIVAYMLIFYIVFTAIFKVASPSSGVLTLNIIMAAIVLCLVPALYEIFAMMKSLLPNRHINVGYIARKLDRLVTTEFSPKELAGFLAMNLKFDYVGLVLNDRIYSSDTSKITKAEVADMLKGAATGVGVWQDVKGGAVHSENKIEKVAVLKDRRGKTCGLVLFGQSIDKDKKSFSAKEMAQIEMVLDLVTVVISDSAIV